MSLTIMQEIHARLICTIQVQCKPKLQLLEFVCEYFFHTLNEHTENILISFHIYKLILLQVNHEFLFLIIARKFLSCPTRQRSATPLLQHSFTPLECMGNTTEKGRLTPILLPFPPASRITETLFSFTTSSVPC